MIRQTRLLAAGVAMAAISVGGVAQAEEKPELPRSMVWTAYDLGSSGYAEASGIANALQQNFDTRVRIIPAGTSIGRILPLTTGQASYGYLANEAFFAAEGSYDFADRQWGPQDIRIALGRPATNGLATAGNAGIETIEDFRGKRVGYVRGNPSVNVKTDAALAFGGLTRDDVEVVWYGSYGPMKTAVIAGQLDAFSSVTTSANVREIEASPRGITWPEFSPDNEAGWDNMLSIISFAEPRRETVGAGISEENPRWLFGYRYPMITSYANKPADEVYNLVKAIDMSFDDFKNTTGSSVNWRVQDSGLPPYDAPGHEGAIRYMQEKGWWTDEAQAWQDARLERLEAVRAAWNAAIDEFEDWRAEQVAAGESVDTEVAWLEFWAEYRHEHLGDVLVDYTN